MNILPLLILAASPPLRPYDVRIIDCYDGDTCTVDFFQGLGQTLSSQEVRLCDVNAPEIWPLATRVAATVSRDALLAKLRAAKRVVAWVPVHDGCAAPALCDRKEKFGRWLVYLVADGVNLNRWLVDSGLAAAYAEKCLLSELVP